MVASERRIYPTHNYLWIKLWSYNKVTLHAFLFFFFYQRCKIICPFNVTQWQKTNKHLHRRWEMRNGRSYHKHPHPPSLSHFFCNLFMNAFCRMAHWKYKWAAKALSIDSARNPEIMLESTSLANFIFVGINQVSNEKVRKLFCIK